MYKIKELKSINSKWDRIQISTPGKVKQTGWNGRRDVHLLEASYGMPPWEQSLFYGNSQFRVYL